MYNHQGIYTIRGDMCYENKMMKTPSATSVGHHPNDTAVCLTVSEEDRADGHNLPRIAPKRAKFKFRPGHLVNTAYILIVGSIIALIELGYFPSHRQGFYCKDPSISHSYRGDTITVSTLIVLSSVIPLLTFCLVEVLRIGPKPKSVARLVWLWYRQMLIGMSLTLFVTEVCKVIMGEPRPHFMTTCLPDVADICTPGSYVTEYRCTNTQYARFIVTDSSRSFPSGHSSLTMYVAMYCTIYLQIRLDTNHLGMLFKPFIMLMIFVLGPVVGITRITDHRHHWWDVLFGLFIGTCGAVYAAIYLCKKFTTKPIRRNTPAASTSTTTLFDIKNKDATSVII